jgi:hypothetical protein
MWPWNHARNAPSQLAIPTDGSAHGVATGAVGGAVWRPPAWAASKPGPPLTQKLAA